jgi:hypothetical protein
MSTIARERLRTIMDRDQVKHFTSCAACGRSFNLGDPVVLACGGWEGPPRPVHQNEAMFDAATMRYVERRCHEAGRGA